MHRTAGRHPSSVLEQVISELQQRLAKNITSLLGVPYELVSGGYSSQQATSKSLENIKVFTTSMMVICQHLQNLLQQVYVSIYGGSVEDVEFILRPTPRINVETVNDLVQLMQTGILSRMDATDVSSMLMGLDFHQSLGRELKPATNAQDRFLTPEQENQGILARASLQTSASGGKKKKPSA